ILTVGQRRRRTILDFGLILRRRFSRKPDRSFHHPTSIPREIFQKYAGERQGEKLQKTASFLIL
ncbi:MAG: hypothetical protein P8Y63_10440, partial [Deltaproteobacteria bacterium]